MTDLGKVPQRHIGPWAREVIKECSASREDRVSQCATWNSYYNTGSNDPSQPAVFNKIYSHIDKLTPNIYSPDDVRYAIEYDKTKDDESRAMGDVAASYLTREFHRCDADISFGEGVETALIKGCTIGKYIWGAHGIDPYIIEPEMFGVYREDINELNKQEAFFHSTYLTPSAVRRLVRGNPNEAEIMAKIEGEQTATSEPERDDMFKQIVIGGINPVSTNPVNNPAGGVVRWMDGPNAILSPEVMKSLVRFDELWVIDPERDDYTTIQIIGEDIPILGANQHINLCNIKQHHPFFQICPNRTRGYFWGRSEVMNLFLGQESFNRRFDGIERMMRNQENPDRAFYGFAGINDEKISVLRQKGWIAEEQPGAKIDVLAPDMPQNMWGDLHEIEGQFNDSAGIDGPISGQGEPGVRSANHAETLVRTGSARLRDRALLVERQLEDAGELFLRILQAQEATAFEIKSSAKPKGGMSGILGKMMGKGAPPQEDNSDEFLLSQLPDDYRVVVDSHSASPAFSNEAKVEAINLMKLGAIDAADYIRLTHPPREDSLIAAAQKKAEAQQQLVAEHPELAFKGSHKR